MAIDSLGILAETAVQVGQGVAFLVHVDSSESVVLQFAVSHPEIWTVSFSNLESRAPWRSLDVGHVGILFPPHYS